jgi:hypothetical protein
MAMEATKINTGGQAFPRAAGPSGSAHCNGDLGMTLRDYFAAKAMASLLNCQAAMGAGDSNENADAEGRGVFMDASHIDDEATTGSLARFAYVMADAMLKARE